LRNTAPSTGTSPRILTERQVFALLEAVADQPRDHALIRLLYNGRLRVSKLVTLRRRNLVDGIADGQRRQDPRGAPLARNLG
jgi:integrase